jgi:hypothetical protein
MAGRSTRELTIAEAAYIAGLLDGEGTVTLSRRHANENRQLVVTIANTEVELLEFVRQATGAGKITHKRAVSERHTPSYCYSVANRQALHLLHQVVPYLTSYKKARADAALQWYVALTPRNGRYTAELRQQRWDFEQAFLSIKSSTATFALTDCESRLVRTLWERCSSGRTPGGTAMVEAAGQLIHLFRGGLDYAFIPAPSAHRSGACYPGRGHPLSGS